jgi:hypothetical protein
MIDAINTPHQLCKSNIKVHHTGPGIRLPMKCLACMILLCCFFELFLPAIAQNDKYVWPITGPISTPYGCESILVGEYVGVYRDVKLGKEWKTSVTYSSPPTVFFRLIQVLKGPPLSGTGFATPIGRKIAIKYEFGDSEVDQPKDWKFDESMLPKIGSKWILFIPDAVRHGYPRAFETFQGSAGRLEFSTENIEKIHAAIDGTVLNELRDCN